MIRPDAILFSHFTDAGLGAPQPRGIGCWWVSAVSQGTLTLPPARARDTKKNRPDAMPFNVRTAPPCAGPLTARPPRRHRAARIVAARSPCRGERSSPPPVPTKDVDARRPNAMRCNVTAVRSARPPPMRTPERNAIQREHGAHHAPTRPAPAGPVPHGVIECDPGRAPASIPRLRRPFRGCGD